MKSRSAIIHGQGVGAGLANRDRSNRTNTVRIPNIYQMISSGLARSAPITLLWLERVYEKAIKFYFVYKNVKENLKEIMNANPRYEFYEAFWNRVINCIKKTEFVIFGMKTVQKN